MARVALIGTFYRRPSLVVPILRAIRAQTRKADEVWLMYEDDADGDALRKASWPGEFFVMKYAPPRDETGRLLAVPPSYQINRVLDMTHADYIVYQADDNLPHPEKIERMAARLDAGANVVYCAQDRGTVGSHEEWLAAIGSTGGIASANEPHGSPYCTVDYTQVMHRKTEDRWPLDMAHMRIGDAVFWNTLLARFGPFEPVPEVLDWHRQMPDGITARWRG